MRCLITGATGYLGTLLVGVLRERGWHVEALLRPDSSPGSLPSGLAFRIADPSSLPSLQGAVEDSACDAVVHLAARPVLRHAHEDWEENVHANVLYGARLLEVLGNRGGGFFLAAGSYWESGSPESPVPYSLYAAGKAALRPFARFYAGHRGVRSTFLSLHNIYGPGDWRGKLFSGLLSAIEKGEPLKATAGTQRLDLVHVRDVCRGFLRALDEPGEAMFSEWSLESRRLYTPRDIADLLARMSGKPCPVEWGSLPPSFLPHLSGPVYPWPVLPGWSPEITLEEGLAEILRERGIPLAAGF